MGDSDSEVEFNFNKHANDNESEGSQNNDDRGHGDMHRYSVRQSVSPVRHERVTDKYRVKRKCNT